MNGKKKEVKDVNTKRMSNFVGLIARLRQDDKQTLGRFYLFNGLDVVFSCCVLELPNRCNQKSISRINARKYLVKRRWSKKYGHHYIICDVEGREYILIHFGNYYKDTEGCLLFGNSFGDINKDGYMDVTSSKKTMERMIKIAPDEFEILITDEIETLT